jgi:membrane fusion protein (multidrug efflux system)
MVMIRHRRTQSPLVLAAMLTLCVAAGCRGGNAPSADERAHPPPVPVNVTSVVGRDEPVTVEATGSFAADELSDVAPEVSGRVVETLVDVGQFVRVGQPLVRIQGVNAGLRLDEARAAAARAQASVRLTESQNTLARTTAERYTALLATGDVSKTLADQAMTQAETSQQEVATARASLAEAQAQLALAEKAVSDVVVAAPFEGTISARHVSPGEYVQPSTPVVTLVKVNPLRLQLSIPGVQAAQVELGQAVTTSVDAYPGKAFSGSVTSVNPVITPESRSFITEVRVPNPKALLKPGMFAVATIDQGRTIRSLFVPRAAVVEDVNTNSWRLFVIGPDSRAQLRVLQLAARQSGNQINVVAGVAEGERVATTRLTDLFDTALVTVVEPASSR